jgi:hypothetical protein
MRKAFISALAVGLFMLAGSLFAVTTVTSFNRTAVAPASSPAANSGALTGMAAASPSFGLLAAEGPATSPCIQPEAPKVHGTSGNKRRFVNPLVPCRPSGPRGNQPTPHA